MFRIDSITDKSLSEAPIFASTNPQYDDRLFIELQVQYMKIPSSNLGRICCVQKLFLTFRTNFCTQHVLPMFCKKKSFWQRFTCRGPHYRGPYCWILEALPLIFAYELFQERPSIDLLLLVFAQNTLFFFLSCFPVPFWIFQTLPPGDFKCYCSIDYSK